MVVVQLLSANENSPGNDIGAGVFGLKIAVAPVMSYSIDHARGHDGCPCHLDGPDGKTNRPEQDDIDDQHQGDTFAAVLVIDIPLQPVIRRTMAVSFHGFQVLGFCAIELRSLPQHFGDPDYLRTVGIIDRFTLGVMLPVYCSPLFRDHPGREPQPEAEKMTRQGMEIQRAMSLMTM